MIESRDTMFGRVQVREIVFDDQEYAANSLTIGVMQAMLNSMADAKSANRPVIITNVGSAFCGGLDSFELLRNLARKGSCKIMLDYLVDIFKAIISHPLPTVAWVDGNAAGGGVGIALCCEYVFARNGITFEIPGGGYRELAQVLVPVIQRRKPKQEFPVEGFVGRGPFSVPEAIEWELINTMFPDGTDMAEFISKKVHPWPPRRRRARQFTEAQLQAIEGNVKKAISPTATRAIAGGLMYQIVQSIERKLNGRK